jgi:chaperonin GroES
MNIKPLADRVLIKPAPAEEKTAGGIIIPDTAKEKPLQGEVLAAGNGTKDEEMVLKAGDTVLYGKYAGTEVELDGEKYLIMRQSDVLAIHYAKSVPKLLFARHKIFILSRMTFMAACHRRTCRQRFPRARAHVRRFAVTFALVCTNRTKVRDYQHLQVCR